MVSLSKLLLSCSNSSGGLRSIPHDCGLEEEIERGGVPLKPVLRDFLSAKEEACQPSF